MVQAAVVNVQPRRKEFGTRSQLRKEKDWLVLLPLLKVEVDTAVFVLRLIVLVEVIVLVVLSGFHRGI